MTIKTVVKRDGTEVPFDSDKLNKWAEWAADNNLAWSDIAIKSLKKLYDGITTQGLHEALIKTCVDYETPEHLRMASRLLRGDIYKTVFGA